MSLHRSVREGIAAIRNGLRQQQQGQEQDDEEAGQLLIRGRRWEQPLNLNSIQHLVDFLRETEVINNHDDNSDTVAAAAVATVATAGAAAAAAAAATTTVSPVVVVQHLKLHAVTIHNRHGELNVLRDYFMQAKKLTKVTIMGCTLGRNADDVEQLLSAFYPNNNNNNTSRSIVHLDFWRLSHLQGEALGRCMGNILHNNHILQRLECWGCPLLGATGVAAMQVALQSNRGGNLLELNLSGCNIGDAGLTCIATAIAENQQHSALQVLNISGTNQITIHGIESGIIRLATCERLRKIDFGHDVLVQVLRHTQHSWQLARVLCRDNLYLQKLIGISIARFPDCRPVVTSILGILSRNKLLAPQPDTDELLDSNSGIWSLALAKFARQSRRRGGGDGGGDDDAIHSPATCILQILQRRPFLVPQVQQRQASQPPPLSVSMIPPPPPPPPMVAQEENSHPNGSNNNNDDNNGFLATTTGNDDGPNKRARLE